MLITSNSIAMQLSDGPFGIPALQAKANFGIGVSGGGLRAAFLDLGWLRGMHMLGLLNKARYLGGASGEIDRQSAERRGRGCFTGYVRRRDKGGDEETPAIVAAFSTGMHQPCPGLIRLL
jgi:hypothetical protein